MIHHVVETPDRRQYLEGPGQIDLVELSCRLQREQPLALLALHARVTRYPQTDVIHQFVGELFHVTDRYFFVSVLVQHHCQ